MYGPVSRGHTRIGRPDHGTVKSRRAGTALSLALAGAGTGKTKTLTAAVVHRIAVGRVAAGWVFAVTFTNKAPTEMSSRILTRRPTGAILARDFPRPCCAPAPDRTRDRRFAARLRQSRCR